jgi:hypothetical protein
LATSPLPPVPAPGQKLPTVKTLFAAIFLLLGFFLCIAKAHIWASGVWNSETFGYAIGGLLLPCLFSYLIAGRKKVRNIFHFGISFVAFCLVFFLIELSNRPPDTRTQVANYFREASGIKPIDPSAPQSEQDKIYRSFISEVMASTKTQQETIAAYRSDLTALYTPDSYSSSQKMQHARDTIQTVYDLDHRFFLDFQEWPARIEQELAKSSLPDVEKQEIMTGVNKTFANAPILALWKQADIAESRWRDDTVTLYTFALAHSGQIRMANGHAWLDDPKVGVEFKELQNKAIDSRRFVRQIKSQITQQHNAQLQSLGLTRKDVGLSDASTPAASPQH